MSKLPPRVTQAECRDAVRETWRRFHAAAKRGDVKLREARVLAAVVERLAGWNRVEERVSHDVLAELCGYSERTVSRALTALAEADVIGYDPGTGWRFSIIRLPDVGGQHVGESFEGQVGGQHVGESPADASGDESGENGSLSPPWVDNMLATSGGQHVVGTNDLDQRSGPRSGPKEKPSVPLSLTDSENRESASGMKTGSEQEQDFEPVSSILGRLIGQGEPAGEAAILAEVEALKAEGILIERGEP